MFEKVLIANRGEIAVRIIRTCQKLGIKTVAVYSKADEKALHVVIADEAVCIGESPATDSYLNKDRIIQAAINMKADAIHPGYGFLSESASFVEACVESGLTFIGPSKTSIEKMGDKAIAKATMKEASVPLIPGTDYATSLEESKTLAETIGYPILLKAIAGGGGKGMRLVHHKDELETSYKAAQNEALKAFGNGDLYLEKYLTHPRHIEVQVMADKYGNTLHLGTRECSMQRNHQKVIEEAPALIPKKLEKAMTEKAILAAKSCDYVNAGTVEFLVEDDQFYFIEMNTRIQVEHPVTEMITGLDLIELQLLVASGEKLPISQKEVSFKGHAIETRLNAEKPYDGFKPSPGTIDFIHIGLGLNVRFDSYLFNGCEIAPYYDSMMGKMIAMGQNRLDAIQRLKSALNETVIHGVEHNQDFLIDLLSQKAFLENTIDTTFINRYLKGSSL